MFSLPDVFKTVSDPAVALARAVKSRGTVLPLMGWLPRPYSPSQFVGHFCFGVAVAQLTTCTLALDQSVRDWVVLLYISSMSKSTMPPWD